MQIAAKTSCTSTPPNRILAIIFGMVPGEGMAFDVNGEFCFQCYKKRHWIFVIGMKFRVCYLIYTSYTKKIRPIVLKKRARLAQ